MSAKNVQCVQRALVVLITIILIFAVVPVRGVLLGQGPQPSVEPSLPLVEEVISTATQVIATSPQIIHGLFNRNEPDIVLDEYIDPALWEYPPMNDGDTTVYDGNDGPENPMLLAGTSEIISNQPHLNGVAIWSRGIYNVGDRSDPVLARRRTEDLSKTIPESEDAHSPSPELSPLGVLSEENMQTVPYDFNGENHGQTLRDLNPSDTLVDSSTYSAPRSPLQSPVELSGLPNLCDECPTTFRTQKQLKEHHVKVHHSIYKPFKCTVEGCPHAAEWFKDLRKHLTSHTKEKAFKCSKCGHRYSRHDNLRRHQKQCTRGRTGSSARVTPHSVLHGSLKR